MIPVSFMANSSFRVGFAAGKAVSLALKCISLCFGFYETNLDFSNEGFAGEPKFYWDPFASRDSGFLGAPCGTILMKDVWERDNVVLVAWLLFLVVIRCYDNQTAAPAGRIAIPLSF